MQKHDNFSKSEKQSIYNSLACVVKSLENYETIIDLRNESYVVGKIKKVDGYMNVEMENVVFVDSKGKKHPFSTFFVGSRNVRYVHIPKGICVKDMVMEQFDKMQPKKIKSHTFKNVRAKRYQQQIVQDLEERDFSKNQPGVS